MPNLTGAVWFGARLLSSASLRKLRDQNVTPFWQDLSLIWQPGAHLKRVARHKLTAEIDAGTDHEHRGHARAGVIPAQPEIIEHRATAVIVGRHIVGDSHVTIGIQPFGLDHAIADLGGGNGLV